MTSVTGTVQPHGNATWVAEQFVSKYYDVLERHPKHLRLFYKEDSTFTVADVQPDNRVVVEAASGSLDDIQDKVMATVATAVVSADKALDAQHSAAEGVLLQVTGTMKLQGAERRFVQTFFLATQEKGYYVRNDMMRIFAPEPAAPPAENGFTALLPPAVAPQQPQQLPAPAPVQRDLLMFTPAPAQPAAVAPAAPVAPPPAPEPSPPAVAPVPAAPAPSAPAPAAPKPATAAPAAAAPAPAPAVASPAAAPAPAGIAQNLTWAERAKLAQANGSTPAGTTPSKPATPAKTPAASAEAAPAEFAQPVVEEAEPEATPSDVPDSNGDLKAASGAADDDEAPKAASGDGTGVYVQGLPQNMSERDMKAMLETEFSRFGAIRASNGINVVCSPRNGFVAYVFYVEEQGQRAALAESGKFKLGDADRPVKILPCLKEFAQGFAPRGGRGGRSYEGGRGMGYRGRGYDGARGRGRADGGRGERPPSAYGMDGGRGRGGRGTDGGRGGRGGYEGRGRGPPRHAGTSGSGGGAGAAAAPKPA